MMRQHGEEHGATIALSGPVAPGLLDGIDPARIGRDRPPGAEQPIENMTEARNNWSIVPCPTEGWATLVHPDLEPDAALERLWEQIAHRLPPRCGRPGRRMVGADGSELSGPATP